MHFYTIDFKYSLIGGNIVISANNIEYYSIAEKKSHIKITLLVEIFKHIERIQLI